VEAPISASPLDFLGSYPDLARWGWHAGVLEEAELERLTEAAARDPAGAAAVYRRALALRDAVDRLFRAVARSATPDGRDLALVWKEHAEADANGRLLPAGDGYAWSWEGTPVDLGRPSGQSPARPSSCSVAGTCTGSGSTPGRATAAGCSTTPAATAPSAGAAWRAVAAG
jgi:hypothetical protein